MFIPTTLPHTVAIDTETTGLSTWRGDRMFSCAAYFVGSGTTRFWRNDDCTWNHATDLAMLLADENIDKVFHSAKFDLRFLEHHGFTVKGRVWDTMVFAHLLDGRDAQGRLNLDDVSRKYLPADKRKVVDEIDQFFESHRIGADSPRRYGFDALPPALLERRNVGDAELTGLLFQRLYSTVARTFPYLLSQEHELLPIVRGMEDRGVLVDHEETARQHVELTNIMDDVQLFCENIIGGYNNRVVDSFNINSRDHQLQLLEIAGLLPALQALPQEYRTKPSKTYPDGNVKIDALNLINLHHPVAAMLLVGKTAKKLRDFVIAFDTEAVNGVIHTQFHQLGTTTGRFSSSSPNLENIPVEGDRRPSFSADEANEISELTGYQLGQHVKRCIRCRPGFAHIHADKSQAEIVALGHYSEDEALMAVIRSGEDIHDGICRVVFNEVTKGLRARSKRVVFGYQYGAGNKKLSLQINGTIAEAIGLRRRLESKMPGLPRWQRFLQGLIAQQGYVETIHGRRHYLAPQESYMGVNRMCQGTVADEVKSRMVAIAHQITANYPEVQQLLNIHDDIGSEVPVSLVPTIVPIINDVMHQLSMPYKLGMPSSLDITYDTWAGLTPVYQMDKLTDTYPITPQGTVPAYAIKPTVKVA